MANKDLFKQAIADAKSVREAAIANAKETLEETLTPHLKDMLAAKLQEMEDAQVEEVVNEDLKEEEVEIAEEETLAEATTEKTDKEETLEEGDGLEAVKAVAEADEDEEEAEDAEEAEDDSEESEDEAEELDGEEEEVEDDEELTDLSVEDFKDLIRDIIAQEMGGGDAEVEDELGDDLDAGEEVPGEEGEELPADVPAEDEEEINLDELLAELEAETAEEVVAEEEEVEEEKEEVNEEEDETSEAHCNKKHEATKKELAEAIETINTMKSELNETNLLNAKLLYVNKIFKANNLTESQKVNVIASFDKAETIKEVKLVHETVSETFITKPAKKAIKEHRGSASQATASTAKPEVISEVSDAVRRMQKLAGII